MHCLGGASLEPPVPDGSRDPRPSPVGRGFVLKIQLLRFPSRGSSRRLAASVRAWDRLGEGKLLASSASEHKNPAEPGRKLGGACMSMSPSLLAESALRLGIGREWKGNHHRRTHENNKITATIAGHELRTDYPLSCTIRAPFREPSADLSVGVVSPRQSKPYWRHQR
jgi:hypothetical protein